MFTLEINGKELNLSFGMGFVRDINETVKQPIDGAPGVFAKRGLAYAIGSIIDGDIEALADVLYTAARHAGGKVKRDEIDAILEDENTNIEELFETVLDFFGKSNCTAKQTKEMLKAVQDANK